MADDENTGYARTGSIEIDAETPEGAQLLTRDIATLLEPGDGHRGVGTDHDLGTSAGARRVVDAMKSAAARLYTEQGHVIDRCLLFTRRAPDGRACEPGGEIACVLFPAGLPKSMVQLRALAERTQAVGAVLILESLAVVIGGSDPVVSPVLQIVIDHGEIGAEAWVAPLHRRTETESAVVGDFVLVASGDSVCGEIPRVLPSRWKD